MTQIRRAARRRCQRRWLAPRLPPDSLSGDPEQEYFAEGMTEQLITELGKLSELRVISI
jgi:TolB-like protein